MRRAYLEAELWWCGDEICNCHQPRIQRRAPNPNVTGVWNISPIWDGTFISNPNEQELEMLREELKVNAARYGIELNDRKYCRGILDL